MQCTVLVSLLLSIACAHCLEPDSITPVEPQRDERIPRDHDLEAAGRLRVRRFSEVMAEEPEFVGGEAYGPSAVHEVEPPTEFSSDAYWPGTESSFIPAGGHEQVPGDPEAGMPGGVADQAYSDLRQLVSPILGRLPPSSVRIVQNPSQCPTGEIVNVQTPYGAAVLVCITNVVDVGELVSVKDSGDIAEQDSAEPTTTPPYLVEVTPVGRGVPPGQRLKLSTGGQRMPTPRTSADQARQLDFTSTTPGTESSFIPAGEHEQVPGDPEAGMPGGVADQTYSDLRQLVSPILGRLPPSSVRIVQNPSQCPTGEIVNVQTPYGAAVLVCITNVVDVDELVSVEDSGDIAEQDSAEPATTPPYLVEVTPVGRGVPPGQRLKLSTGGQRMPTSRTPADQTRQLDFASTTRPRAPIVQETNPPETAPAPSPTPPAPTAAQTTTPTTPPTTTPTTPPTTTPTTKPTTQPTTTPTTPPTTTPTTPPTTTPTTKPTTQPTTTLTTPPTPTPTTPPTTTPTTPPTTTPTTPPTTTPTTAPTTAPTTKSTTAPTTLPPPAESTPRTDPPTLPPTTEQGTAGGLPAVTATDIPPIVTLQNWPKSSGGSRQVDVVATGIAKTCGWEVLLRMIVVNGCQFPCWATDQTVQFWSGQLRLLILQALSKQTGQCWPRPAYCLAVKTFLDTWCAKTRLKGQLAFRTRRSVPRQYDLDSVIADAIGEDVMSADKIDRAQLVAEVQETMLELQDTMHAFPESRDTRHMTSKRYMYASAARSSSRRRRSARSSAPFILTAQQHLSVWNILQANCCTSTRGCSSLWLRQNTCVFQKPRGK